MNPFTALTSKIYGGLAIAALVAVGILVWQLNGVRSDLTDTQNALAVEKANHAVTRASVATLEQAIKAKNDESNARAKALADARQKVADDAKRLEGLSRSTDKQIAALRGQIGKHTADCATPDLGG